MPTNVETRIGRPRANASQVRHGSSKESEPDAALLVPDADFLAVAICRTRSAVIATATTDVVAKKKESPPESA